MAGAGYKLFNTGDVLTAAQVNTYLNEQTVMVFASSAARTTALSGVLAEGMVSYLQDTNAVEVYNGSAWVGVSGAGDVTEVQAGTGISVASGTGPIPVVTNTMATAIDAEGDLIIGDAADAFQRLAIGSNTHVLTVDTSVDGKIKWAAPAAGGGWTQISSQSLSGASVSFSSIVGTYQQLILVMQDFVCATDGTQIVMRFNSDSGSNYYQYIFSNSNGTQANATSNTNTGIFTSHFEMDNTDFNNFSVWTITNYANTNSVKLATGNTWYKRNSTSAYAMDGHIQVWNSTSAITDISLSPASGNFSQGTAILYGVK